MIHKPHGWVILEFTKEDDVFFKFLLVGAAAIQMEIHGDLAQALPSSPFYQNAVTTGFGIRSQVLVTTLLLMEKTAILFILVKFFQILLKNQ